MAGELCPPPGRLLRPFRALRFFLTRIPRASLAQLSRAAGLGWYVLGFQPKKEAAGFAGHLAIWRGVRCGAGLKLSANSSTKLPSKPLKAAPGRPRPRDRAAPLKPGIQKGSADQILGGASHAAAASSPGRFAAAFAPTLSARARSLAKADFSRRCTPCRP